MQKPTEADLRKVKADLHRCWLSSRDIYNITTMGRMILYTPRRVRAMLQDMKVPLDWLHTVNLCGPEHSRAHEGVVAWVIAQMTAEDAQPPHDTPEWIRGFTTCDTEKALMTYVEGWLGDGVMLADGWYSINTIEWID